MSMVAAYLTRSRFLTKEGHRVESRFSLPNFTEVFLRTGKLKVREQFVPLIGHVPCSIRDSTKNSECYRSRHSLLLLRRNTRMVDHWNPRRFQFSSFKFFFGDFLDGKWAAFGDTLANDVKMYMYMIGRAAENIPLTANMLSELY